MKTYILALLKGREKVFGKRMGFRWSICFRLAELRARREKARRTRKTGWYDGKTTC